MSGYEDIINHPRHISDHRARMSIHDRAAQFAPFAALTGYEDVIEETGRLTQGMIELDEGTKLELSGKLQILQQRLNEKPFVTIRYFQADPRKAGGAYISVSGHVSKIDPVDQALQLDRGEWIPFWLIYAIEGQGLEE